MKPQVKIERLEMGDPTFEAGESKTARAQLTNPTTKQFAYKTELYLGATKVATSGAVMVAIPAGQTAAANWPIVMPLTEAEFEVYLDVWVDTTLIAHYKATENVITKITPKIEVGPITWV